MTAVPVVRTITRITPADYRRLLWPLAFVLILVGGFVLAGTGYNHGLPYVDTGDEMTFWTMGRAYIDPTWDMYIKNYPPGLVILYGVVQRTQIAMGEQFLNVGKTVEVVRFISVLAHTVALAVIMLLAFRFGGPIAGIAAGLFWATLPLALGLARIATGNPILSAWFIASIAAGIEGGYRRSVGWIATSLILAIIATLFKWQCAPALGIAGLAILHFWNTDRRKTIVLLAGYLMVVGALSYWVIFIHKALEGEIYLPGVKTTAPTPDLILINLQYQLTSLGPILVILILPLVGLALSALIPAERRRLHGSTKTWMFWSLPIMVILYNAILSFNGAPLFDRHYLAAMTVMCVLAGVGVALLVRLAQQIGDRIKQPFAGKALAALVLVITLEPVVGMFNQGRALASDLTRPDTRTYFAEWARSTLPDVPVLITEPTVAAAVQTLYGYLGRPIDTPYNQGVSVYVPDHEVTQDLIDAKNIRYIIAGADFKGEHLTTPITRLITLRPGGVFRGVPWAAFYVGALPLLSEPVTFGGEVVLRGMALSKQAVCPGESLDLQLFWGAARTPTRLYSAYVHLFSEKTGEFTIPLGGPPASNNRPTISWIAPDELLIGPIQTWTPPADLAPGDYQIWIGVFEPIADSRLKLPDGTDHYVAGTIQIKSCTQN
jgi:thiamine transporter ThiT